MSRKVLVDDTDTQIKYSGQGWFQDRGSQDSVGEYGTTYNRTSHGTNQNGTFSFSFKGSYIGVFGTSNLAELDDGKHYDPKWDCIVDGISIGTTDPISYPENNWILCEKDLDDGPHEIVVSVRTTGNTFWLDYVAFAPSASVSYNKSILRISNGDPGIWLDSKWVSSGGLATTTVVGSQAKFNFTGTSVTWVGFFDISEADMPRDAASGTFAVDGGDPTTFKLNSLTSDSDSFSFNQPLFSTPDLTAGPHSILVTYKGGSGHTRPLTLDYLLVTNTSLSQPSPVQVISSSNLPTAFSSISASSSSTGAPLGDDGDGSQHSKPPIGAIVGGVIGGVIILAVAILLLWLQRQRHQRRAGQLIKPEAFLDSGSNTPHSGTRFGSLRGKTGMRRESKSTSPTQSDASRPSFPVSPVSVNTGHSSLHASVYTATYDSLTANGSASGLVEHPLPKQRTTRALPSPPTITTVVHQDSGFRMQSPERPNVTVKDVPPLYTPD